MAYTDIDKPSDYIRIQTAALAFGGSTPTVSTATEEYNGATWTSSPASLATGRIYFGKNGTWQNSGDPSAGTGYVGTAPMTSDYIGFAVGGNGGDGGTGDQIMLANFGNPPFTISSGNSDGNGYGNFEYSVPSGYYALNTKNLAEYG